MESLGAAAVRLLAKLDARRAKNEIAGRVEQSESSNVFPDATERRPALRIIDGSERDHCT